MAVGRSRLARVLGPILIFLGVLLLAVAVAGPLYVSDKLKTLPLSTDITTVARSVPSVDPAVKGKGRVLDQCSVMDEKAQHAVVAGADLTQQTRTLVVEPSNADKLTFQSGTTLQVHAWDASAKRAPAPREAPGGGALKCNDATLLAWVDFATVSRKTAEPVAGRSETVYTPSTEVKGKATPAKAVTQDDRKGLQYRFPFDVDADSGGYQYFDPITRSNVDLQVVGNEEGTIHFRAEVPRTNLTTVPGLRPGDRDPWMVTQIQKSAQWWGLGGDADRQVKLDRFATTSVDLWVDQKSGIIVNNRTSYEQSFGFPTPVSPDVPKDEADFQLPVFSTTLGWDSQTREARQSAADAASLRLTLAERVTPIVGGVLGALALIAGIAVLVLGRGKPGPDSAGTDAAGTDTTGLDATGPDANGPDAGAPEGEPDAVTEAFTAQAAGDAPTDMLDLRKDPPNTDR